MDNASINGFMVMVYSTMEKMNTEERRFFIRSIKQAKRILDFNYPLGKPEEKKSDIILPTGGESVEILRPNT